MTRKCSESDINKIYLMLGNACNFHCKYCIQDNMCYPTKKEPTEEVYQYIRHLVRIRPNYDDKLLLLFWGGEPLLYIDTIMRVVDKLGDIVHYAIVTNGSLLDDDLVDYFNEHNIHISISNDGPNTKCTRGQDVLDDPAKLATISRLKDLSIETVISKYNYDFSELCEYLDSKLQREVLITVDMLQVTWDMPADLYDIPLNEYERSLREVADKALSDMIELKDTREVELFQPCVGNILIGKKLKKPWCGIFYNNLNINCDGDMFVCHNSGEKIGHIREERMYISERMSKWLDQHHEEDCSSCEFFEICQSCPLECGRKYKMCAARKVFYKVCIDLANAFLASFEPVDWSVDKDDKNLSLEY